MNGCDLIMVERMPDQFFEQSILSSLKSSLDRKHQSKVVILPSTETAKMVILDWTFDLRILDIICS